MINKTLEQPPLRELSEEKPDSSHARSQHIAACASGQHTAARAGHSTLQSIAAENGRMVKVQGKAASGKTQALIERCVHLVEAGADANDIVVSTSSSFTAADVRSRLDAAFAQAGIEGAKSIRVARALDLCALVLAEPEALKATGRQANLLNAAEYKFFLEDMRTLGQPARRLRGMLSFFYRQWSNLATRSEWAIGGEENELHAHMVKVLKAQNAMLEQEAPYLCADFLKSEAGAKLRKRFPYVLADDFQDYSRAEQTCLCLLAGTQIIVAGNAGETIERKGSYPCPDGFAQFEKTRQNVCVFTLSSTFCENDIADFTEAVGRNDERYRAVVLAQGEKSASCEDGENTQESSALKKSADAQTSKTDPDEPLLSGGPFANRCAIVKWPEPEDEINGMTKYIRALADKAPEESICVVVANKQWARTVENVLGTRGFSVCCAESEGELGGDPRTKERARALMSYTLLKLMAKPDSVTAWRCWCGFDNYLTNSDAWSGLIEYAQKQNTTIEEALGALADMQRAGEDEPFLRAFALADRYNEGKALVEQHKNRKGFSLLRAIGAEGLHEFEGVSRKIAGDERAEELFAIADRDIFCPEFEIPAKANVIHIATYKTIAGLAHDNVFVIGCVDGFMPKRDAFEVVSTEEDRQHIMRAERRAFLRTVSAARKRLVLSYFSKAPLELAERTKMQVTRVRSENDERLALVRPSSFLAEAEASLPSTIGGQAFLAEAGL